MAFTTNASNALLNGMTGRNSYGILSRCYMGLSTTTPTPDGNNFTEPDASTGYSRVLIGDSSYPITYNMGNPNNGTISNDKMIIFNEATASWGTVTHFGLFTSNNLNSVSASLMIYGPLDNSVTVAAHYVPLFRTNNFTMELT